MWKEFHPPELKRSIHNLKGSIHKYSVLFKVLDMNAKTQTVRKMHNHTFEISFAHFLQKSIPLSQYH